VGEVISPMSGKVISIEDVDDPIFSEKVSGDGVAVILDSPVVYAPVSGEISVFFDTKHAFMITADNGVQVLVHIGLDSIIMEGVGITAFKNRGERVEAGEKIVEIDLPFFKRRHINMVSPILVVNYEKLKKLEYKNVGNVVEAGKDIVLDYEI